MASLNTLKTLRQAKSVAREPYAWPGGYPRILVMNDGGTLCPVCVRKEFQCIAQSAIGGYKDGWNPACADINWEDSDLYCDHCCKRIPPACGDSKN